jgi:hypothetical protein
LRNYFQSVGKQRLQQSGKRRVNKCDEEYFDENILVKTTADKSSSISSGGFHGVPAGHLPGTSACRSLRDCIPGL